ncbi:MAG TPA: virulence factor [Ilumatobacteraceae bacterium]|nr:virulence factor [Ilumatobacteraceae bacterium]
MPRRGSANDLTIITWRDIPAQVNGGAGENKHQRILPQRFQGAIDRAAMKAGKKTAGEYVAEWKRRTVPIPPELAGDVEAAVLAEAERLEAEFPTERLKLWVATGGWDPDRPEEERI